MSRFTSLCVVLLFWLLLLSMRAAAPSTLGDKDQPRVAFYVLDVVDRGQWVLQCSDGKDLASKPPLYQWVSGSISLLSGRVNDLTLLAPAALSGLLALLVVWGLGCDLGTRAARGDYWKTGDAGGVAAAGGADGEVLRLDPMQVYPDRAGSALGCLAGLIWASTYHVQRLQWTARTDMMVTALGLAGIGLAWRLQHTRFEGAGRLRLLFWIVIALGLLTKGPVMLGVVFGALLVECLFRRTLRPLLAPWPWIGLPLALIPFVLWFLAAWRAGGEAFWNLQVRSEFLDRVAGSGERAQNARPLWYFVPIFLVRFLPWSAVLVVSARRWWGERLWKEDHPFVAPLAWLIGMFLVFSLPMGKRPDYILPAYGPAALLVGAVMFDWLRRGGDAFAGREGEKRWTFAPRRTWSASARRWGVVGLLVLGLLGNGAYFFLGTEGARDGEGDRDRRFGVAARELAETAPGRLIYCDPGTSLVQYYLRTNQRSLDVPEAAAAVRDLLGRGSVGGVWVVTRSKRVEELREALGGGVVLVERLREKHKKKEGGALVLVWATLPPSRESGM